MKSDVIMTIKSQPVELNLHEIKGEIQLFNNASHHM